jgi:trimethylamine--corrinoid protein Co-methyltransferase
MTAPHTMAHMRKEYFNGNGVTDRKNRDRWVKEGSLDARQRALAIAKKLLAKQTAYIPDEVDTAIREKFNILLPRQK